jgi:hypothetical protein
MSADQHAEVNIELNEIGAAIAPVLDRLSCPVRCILATIGATSAAGRRSQNRCRPHSIGCSPATRT